MIYESHIIDQVVTSNLLRWLLLFMIVDRSCPGHQAYKDCHKGISCKCYALAQVI